MRAPASWASVSIAKAHEARVLLERGHSLDAAQRRPELCGACLGARHDACARRVHPRRAGHQRGGQRHPLAGARRRRPQPDRDQRRSGPREERAERRAAREERPVRVQAGRLRTGAQAQPAGVCAGRLQPAARHLPPDADEPRRVGRAAGRARPVEPARRAPRHRPRDRRRAEPPGADQHDPLRHAHDQADDGAARGAARVRLGAA